MNAAIAFKANDRDSRDTARLVETGAKKLAQLYTKRVAEGSSGSSPIGGLDFTPQPFPPDLLSSIQPLVVFLRTLPTPATHPSHPAASAIQSTLKEAQRGYADMRGSWSKKGLETYAKRVIDRAETIDAVSNGREFGKWVENMMTVAEVSISLDITSGVTLISLHDRTNGICSTITRPIPLTDLQYPPYPTSHSFQQHALISDISHKMLPP